MMTNDCYWTPRSNAYLIEWMPLMMNDGHSYFLCLWYDLLWLILIEPVLSCLTESFLVSHSLTHTLSLSFSFLFFFFLRFMTTILSSSCFYLYSSEYPLSIFHAMPTEPETMKASIHASMGSTCLTIDDVRAMMTVSQYSSDGWTWADLNWLS